MTRSDALGFLLAAVLLAEWLIFDLSVIGVLAPVLVFLVLLLDGVFRPASRWLMPVITHGARDGNQVSLTFDDGPDPIVTPAILDALRSAGAKATFFSIGRHIEAYPELAQRIHAEGHELANHSFGHSRALNFARDGAMRAEILKGARAVQAVTGMSKLPLYRPPVGLKNPPLARVANKIGLTVVNWSLHGRDTGGADAERIAARVLAGIQPGDIVVLHDGHDLDGKTRPQTVEALQMILDGLREKQLQAVTVSRLLDSA